MRVNTVPQIVSQAVAKQGDKSDSPSKSFAAILNQTTQARKQESAVSTKAANNTSTIPPTDPNYFSIEQTSPSGSKTPGFQEALYAFLNQPGSTLTRAEKNVFAFTAVMAAAGASSGDPQTLSMFPGFAGAGTSSFNPQAALLSALDSLGEKNPNFTSAAQQWVANLSSNSKNQT